MLSIGDLLKQKAEFAVPQRDLKKPRSERAEILQQLFVMYTSPNERHLRKLENWRRYIAWLKLHRTKHTPETVEKFKKQKEFIKEVTEDRFWYFVCHVPTKDLYAAKSVMMDKINRKESASAYVISLARQK